MKGWKHWDDNGVRAELENPAWREDLAKYVEIGADDSVKLNIDSALKLAYVHSPSHQNQLETLYLSALDVTTERFRLDTQFFGGYDAKYTHNGTLKSDQLTVGADPTLQAQRRFAKAGELLVGFASFNSSHARQLRSKTRLLSCRIVWASCRTMWASNRSVRS